MIRSLLLVSLLAGGLWQIGQGGLIQAKAVLGQLLLERAFAAADADEPVQEPWPGAVSYPVARLHVPSQGIRRLVLEGADSPVLAWGPGMEIGPNGHRLIAAHRDTHFRFLEHVEPGETMSVEWVDGSIEHWRVVERQVVDSRITAIDMALEADQLTLVTCYPFTATTNGGPLRLVLTLTPEIEPLTTDYRLPTTDYRLPTNDHPVHQRTEPVRTPPLRTARDPGSPAPGTRPARFQATICTPQAGLADTLLDDMG